MPTWDEVLREIREIKELNSTDIVRRKYIKKLAEKTGRNVIVYYSGFLNNSGSIETIISDTDKNGFMNAINGLDRSKGLDLILHTPGGNLAAAESLVDYLRLMFGKDIRAIIPQISMSAGTMIACSCKSIVMGKQSNLGPIDPQVRGLSAYEVIEEFKRAIEMVSKDPKQIPIWQTIIGKYNPTFIGECEKSIQWSEELAKQWLKGNMFAGNPNCEKIVSDIVTYLLDHYATKTHSRHISIDDCEKIGLKIERMEEDGELQDAILSIHHACMITLTSTLAIKIFENNNGHAMIINKPIPMELVQQNPMPSQLSRLNSRQKIEKDKKQNRRR